VTGLWSWPSTLTSTVVAVISTIRVRSFPAFASSWRTIDEAVPGVVKSGPDGVLVGLAFGVVAGLWLGYALVVAMGATAAHCVLGKITPFFRNHL